MDLVVIFFIPMFIALIASFICFDQILRHLYNQDFQLWEQEGRPLGFYWAPYESKRWGWFPSFGSTRARNRLSFQWLYHTPEWMKSDPKILQKLKWYRILIIFWNLAMLTLIISEAVFHVA